MAQSGRMGLMQRLAKITLAAALLAVISAPVALAGAGERIRAFDSEVVISPDGSILVTETITIDALGVDIKRGIYRDFPTTYGGIFSLRTNVPFTIIEVKRDGRSEPFRIEKVGSDTRVYIGDAGVYLASGTYVYTLKYQTDNQLGFFDDTDEFYWNVTGNDWVFPIGRVTARIIPPPGVPAETVEGIAFTGLKGATGEDYRVSVAQTGVVEFNTTRSLASGEGLTVAVSWPKGYVVEPTALERREGLISANLDALVSLLGILAVLLWYAYAWMRVGRDPKEGTIIARYEPPDDVSPAAARYVLRMGSDDKALAAAVISMAVKGAITIHEQDRFLGNTYSVSRAKAEEANLSSDEQKLYSALLGNKRDTFEFDKKNHVVMKQAKDAFTAALKKKFQKKAFRLNRAWVAPGIIASLVVLYAGATVAANIVQTEFFGLVVPLTLMFVLVWTSIWAIVLFATVKNIKDKFFEYRDANGFKRVTAAMSLFGVSFLALLLLLPQLMGVFFIGGLASAFVAYATLILILTNMLAFWLLRAPTPLGRKLMDHLEGLRMFLSVTEKDRLEFSNPPNATPELFEKMLPYAFALGVAHEWSEQFKVHLVRASEAGKPYAPLWYVGSSWDSFRTGDFASSFGSALSGAISSASTAPGSSSGFSGGSSGGGGGGGGGGGW